MLIPLFAKPLIDGEMSSYQIQPNYYRYHLVMSIGHRKTPSIYVLADCDNNRTPVIIKRHDIYRFVGDICNVAIKKAGP